MSLITCCPACGTMFRVVPDQLKISDGWVRCGHCAEVFDATAYLVTQPPSDAMELSPQESPERSPTPPPPAYIATQRHEPVARRTAQGRESVAWPPEPEPDGAPHHAMAEVHMAALATTAPMPALPDREAGDAPPDSELKESPLDQPFVFRRSDLADGGEPPPISTPAVLTSEFSASRLPDPEDDNPVAVEDVPFLRAARRRAFWRRPGVRAALVLALLLLGSLLAGQVMVHDRDRLAVMHPELRAWLDGLCEPLACRVGPPRQIEAVLIDSSSFNKLRNDTYRLNFTLKNGAVHPIAVPSMELTLTDTQDQPVLRRVLTPAEMGATFGTLGGHAEWSGSLAVLVAANGQNARIAGYRLLAFYP